ncbi:MAG: hypothetical protein ABIQ16_03650 [Polyangiaceae bacterium]
MASGSGGSSWQRSGAVFYRYTDASGIVHIVDSLDRVPMAQRERASRIQYDDWTAVSGDRPQNGIVGVLHRAEALGGWQMFGLGAGTVLLGALVFRLLPGARGLVLRVAIALGVAALIGGAYFGWARRVAHQSKDLFATPDTLIEDAKAAVEKMNAHVKAQQAQLKDAEQTK